MVGRQETRSPNGRGGWALCGSSSAPPIPAAPAGGMLSSQHCVLTGLGLGLGVGEQRQWGVSGWGRAPGCRPHGRDGAAAPDGGTGGVQAPAAEPVASLGGEQQELAGAPRRVWIHLQLRSHLSRSKRGETSANHG